MKQLRAQISGDQRALAEWDVRFPGPAGLISFSQVTSVTQTCNFS